MLAPQSTATTAAVPHPNYEADDGGGSSSSATAAASGTGAGEEQQSSSSTTDSGVDASTNCWNTATGTTTDSGFQWQPNGGQSSGVAAQLATERSAQQQNESSSKMPSPKHSQTDFLPAPKNNGHNQQSCSATTANCSTTFGLTDYVPDPNKPEERGTNLLASTKHLQTAGTMAQQQRKVTNGGRAVVGGPARVAIAPNFPATNTTTIRGAFGEHTSS